MTITVSIADPAASPQAITGDYLVFEGVQIAMLPGALKREILISAHSGVRGYMFSCVVCFGRCTSLAGYSCENNSRDAIAAAIEEVAASLIVSIEQGLPGVRTSEKELELYQEWLAVICGLSLMGRLAQRFEAPIRRYLTLPEKDKVAFDLDVASRLNL